MLRIFDAYGDQLTPEAWSICLQAVIFKLLSSIEAQLEAISQSDSSISEKDRLGWNETTVVVLSGITNLLADYLDVVSTHETFAKSWQTLLEHFRTLLDFKVLEINTAVFEALRKILSNGNLENAKQNLDKHAIDIAWVTWSSSLPVIAVDTSAKRFDNQKYLIAYVSAVQEIYRLFHTEMNEERVQRMLHLLQEALQQASAASYSADIEYLTPLQTQVLEVLKMIRTDFEGVPAALISRVAKFIELAFEPKDTGSEKQKPTYVALSKASMALSESLIVTHFANHDIYDLGAITETLNALAKPIVLKYSFTTVTKSVQPWRQATTFSLEILKSILPIITKAGLKDDTVRPIWTAIVTIANAITKADCSSLPSTSTNNINDDQDFDISTFITLRALITPALGASIIPDKTRRTYTESLFHTSLIHAPLPSELPQPNQELLSSLYTPRKGRTVDPVPSPRSRMSYICLSTLLSLVSLSSSSGPEIKLAQAAAPYLILRASLTLRAYIADQPLRGRMPQPLSERRELLFVLKELVALKCEPEAIPEAQGVESEGRRHLHRLYPLLAKAVRAAAADQEVLEWIGKALDEVGVEFGL